MTTDVQGLPLVAGSSQGPTGKRSRSCGSPPLVPDQSFGNASQRVNPIGTPSPVTLAQADAVAVRSDGKIWLSGTVLNDGGIDDNLAVVRLGPSGQDDDTFGLSDNSQEVYPLPSGQSVFGPGALFVQSNAFPLIAEDGEIGDSTDPEFVLARLTSNVCTLCGAVTVTPTPSSIVFTTNHGAGGPSMGILVQRLLHGKVVQVARVPFGPQPLGRVRLKWNRKVAGKPLQPGTYLITVRALDQHGHVVALSKRVRIVVRGRSTATRA